jgi:hypothetical protein
MPGGPVKTRANPRTGAILALLLASGLPYCGNDTGSGELGTQVMSQMVGSMKKASAMKIATATKPSAPFSIAFRAKVLLMISIPTTG